MNRNISRVLAYIKIMEGERKAFNGRPACNTSDLLLVIVKGPSQAQGKSLSLLRPRKMEWRRH